MAVGKRVATEDPQDLVYIVKLEQAVKEAKVVAVRGLQQTGYSNRQIGEVLGVTRQAIALQWPGGADDPDGTSESPAAGNAGDRSSS